VNAPLFETDCLSLSYGSRRVFEDISLAVPKGSVTAIVGPSGCGKTSFLFTLNRLTDMLPGCRVTGRLHMDGIDLLHPGLDLIGLRRRVGLVFQKPNPFPLSISRNLELALKEHGFPRRERPALVEQALRDVGLWEEVKDRLHTSALSLSGGQQQRLVTARALVLQPEVMLYDEPCSALDPLAGAVLEELITSLRGRLTQVVVTHNLAQARRLADYVAVFWMAFGVGRVIEHGPAAKVFADPQHEMTAQYLAGLRG
jgi:phosphate transport system ATP-binding protein